MSGEPLEIDAGVILSVERSMLGVITPDLRAVAVGWHEGTIRARFIYDRPVAEDDWDEIISAEAEVVADHWPRPVQFEADYSDAPIIERLPGETWWVYARREPAPAPLGELERAPLWSGAALVSAYGELPTFRVKVMLSVQQALLGVIWPEIRVVLAGGDGGVARTHFILDRPVVDEDLAIIGAVEAVVDADFGGTVATSSTADFTMQRPIEYDTQKWSAVYARQEPDD